ncbi:hypothetical protein Dvina_47320 [Dactylosporangium vinaceum]|uniref:Uncharacterized protein n=1 Tax=Dactylosporangium vinaceum TaxID=53362 RepID=A0ABV5M5G0_9ACTN|nr:hypothetical protein [Dactylosporangium vinaceum]UAB95542.1 hypothetical protein Dvina_47320 [Dactylosporangium vinaceum]
MQGGDQVGAPLSDGALVDVALFGDLSGGRYRHLGEQQEALNALGRAGTRCQPVDRGLQRASQPGVRVTGRVALVGVIGVESGERAHLVTVVARQHGVLQQAPRLCQQRLPPRAGVVPL